MGVRVRVNGRWVDVPPLGVVTLGRATNGPPGSDTTHVTHIRIESRMPEDKRMSRWAMRVTDVGYGYVIGSSQSVGAGLVQVRPTDNVDWRTLNHGEAVTWAAPHAYARLVLAGDADAVVTVSLSAEELMPPAAPKVTTGTTASTRADPEVERDIREADRWLRVLAALCADYVRTGLVSDIASSRARSLFNAMSGLSAASRNSFYRGLAEARAKLNAPEETVDLTSLARMAVDLGLVTPNDGMAVLRYAGRSRGVNA